MCQSGTAPHGADGIQTQIFTSEARALDNALPGGPQGAESSQREEGGLPTYRMEWLLPGSRVLVLPRHLEDIAGDLG